MKVALRTRVAGPTIQPQRAVRRWVVLFAWAAMVSMAGCATHLGGERQPALQGEALRPESGQGGSGFEPQDDFQLLLQAASVEQDAWHGAAEELELEEARELWKVLAHSKTTLRNFGPRRTLLFLLRLQVAQREDVPYEEVLRRLSLFRPLVVMRPDGYLVGALSGRPLQRMGRVELRGGRFMAGSFEVGAFYRDKGGAFYAVDDALLPAGGVLGELGLERDVLNAALDGSELALGELGLALGQFVTSPVRSVQGLQQFPAAVAALIASSPDYFARYSTLPLQEQIREAARLSTHLLLLYGSAAGAAARVGAAGATLPVLSLSAEGTVVVEQVGVPLGAAVTALGTGGGALYVLMGAGGGSGGFKPFTADNFRENLARLTGRMPQGAHAHHVFPQKLMDKFKEAGLNIHDPRFGVWWEESSHLKNAARYLNLWQKFLERNPTLEEILQFGRELGDEFGFQVNY